MKTISSKTFREKYGKAKTNKYKAQKTTIEGEHFPSKFEAAGWMLFRSRERAGNVRSLRRYETVRLSDAGITYKPDWSYIDVATDAKVFVEMKGVVTDRFRLICKLWRAYGPAPLEIYKGTHRKIYLAETIIPGATK